MYCFYTASDVVHVTAGDDNLAYLQIPSYIDSDAGDILLTSYRGIYCMYIHIYKYTYVYTATLLPKFMCFAADENSAISTNIFPTCHVWANKCTLISDDTYADFLLKLTYILLYTYILNCVDCITMHCILCISSLTPLL